MSNFDPNKFLDATISEPSTKRVPLPAGQEYTGTVKDVKMRSWVGKKDPTQSGAVADVHIEIDVTSNPAAHKALGTAAYDRVVLVDGVMLDTTEAGAIDNSPGKNSKLRRYREALNMNKPGDSFSFRNMIGRLIKVKVKHEPYEGEMYDKIDSVLKA